jgi:hypothetical protein
MLPSMCNDYGNHVPYSDYLAAFSQNRIRVKWPAAVPNLEPRDDIWPTDPGPVIRRLEDGTNEFAVLRWGFPPAKPKGAAMVSANQLVALDLALAEQSALMWTTTVEGSPSRLGPDERKVNAGRRYGKGAGTSQIGKTRHANEGVRFHVDYSMLTLSGRPLRGPCPPTDLPLQRARPINHKSADRSARHSPSFDGERRLGFTAHVGRGVHGGPRVDAAAGYRGSTALFQGSN